MGSITGEGISWGNMWKVGGWNLEKLENYNDDGGLVGGQGGGNGKGMKIDQRRI